MKPVWWTLAAAAVIGCAALAAEEGKKIKMVPVAPTETHVVDGRQLFHNYCATCHGHDLKGNGPVASALKMPPPDLTLLAKQNNGKFPELAVMRSIRGDDVVAAHGDKEMPVWGPVFRSMSANESLGELRARNLTKYIETMQAK